MAKTEDRGGHVRGAVDEPDVAPVEPPTVERRRSVAGEHHRSDYRPGARDSASNAAASAGSEHNTVIPEAAEGSRGGTMETLPMPEGEGSEVFTRTAGTRREGEE